jgi:hypothetical protein
VVQVPPCALPCARWRSRQQQQHHQRTSQGCCFRGLQRSRIRPATAMPPHHALTKRWFQMRWCVLRWCVLGWCVLGGPWSWPSSWTQYPSSSRPSRSKTGAPPGTITLPKVDAGHKVAYQCFGSSLQLLFPRCPTPAAACRKRPRRPPDIGTPCGDRAPPPGFPKARRYGGARMERPVAV